MSFTAIFSEFPAQLGPEVAFVGPGERDSEGRPSRVSWQPVSAQHHPPRRIGGGPGDDGPILTRVWVILLEIWAADLDATVVLTDKFLGVAHNLLSQHGYQPGSEEWELGGASSKGVVCRMRFNLQTPILRRPRPTRPIETINSAFLLNDTAV